MKTLIFIIALWSCSVFTTASGKAITNALAADSSLCTSDRDQLACLENNFQVLYLQDNRRFWQILRDSRERAFSCRSHEATLRFLKLAALKKRGAEFEEFFSEAIEQMATKKTNCFLSAMNSSDSQVRHALVVQLHHPLIVDKSSIEKIFRKAQLRPKFKNLSTEFFNYDRDAKNR